MEAIVLAGGLGTRLRSVVPNLPKPMAPVAGRPFLEIVLNRLAQKGFRRVVLSVGYMAEKIVEHFGDRLSGMELVYAFESTPLGTGGAVRFAFSFWKTDHVFVLNGDTYLDLEVAEVEAQWQVNHRPIIVAREVADTARFGSLEIRNGTVSRFLEKGATGPGLINAGCYVLVPDSLDAFPSGQAFSFENDYLAHAIRQNIFHCFVTCGYFLDIGDPQDYARAHRDLSVYSWIPDPETFRNSVDICAKNGAAPYNRIACARCQSTMCREREVHYVDCIYGLERLMGDLLLESDFRAA